jgi:hypothetical protein
VETEEDKEQEAALEKWTNDGKPALKSATTAHSIRFVNELLDTMDAAGDMKDFYFVRDNCQRKTLRRDYKYLYLPLYTRTLFY